MNSTSAFTKRTLVLGTNGTGKTYFATEVAEATVKAGGRVLVVVKNDLIWEEARLITEKELPFFKGIARILYRSNKTLHAIASNYHTGLLILDDAKNFIKSNIQEDMINLLIDSRHKRINIITVAHGFTQVPPAFFTFATEFVIFRTTDNVKKRKDEVNNYEKVKRTVNHVNHVNSKRMRQGQKPWYYKIITN